MRWTRERERRRRRSDADQLRISTPILPSQSLTACGALFAGPVPVILPYHTVCGWLLLRSSAATTCAAKTRPWLFFLWPNWPLSLLLLSSPVSGCVPHGFNGRSSPVRASDPVRYVLFIWQLVVLNDLTDADDHSPGRCHFRPSPYIDLYHAPSSRRGQK